MEKHEKKVIDGDGGSLIIQNVSGSESQSIFKVEVTTEAKKSLLSRIKDVFLPRNTSGVTIYFDRNGGKAISGYFYNHITTADKVYKGFKTPTAKTEKVKKTPSPKI